MEQGAFVITAFIEHVYNFVAVSDLFSLPTDQNNMNFILDRLAIVPGLERVACEIVYIRP